MRNKDLILQEEIDTLEGLDQEYQRLYGNPLRRVLEPEMNPAPEAVPFERKQSNAEILKSIMELYGKGGDK